MTIRSRYLVWTIPAIGALALGAFLLAGAAILMNVKSRSADGRTAGTRASEVTSLRWNQIEATDDPTYAANLRALGCPEGTIEAILQARASKKSSVDSEDAPEIPAAPIARASSAMASMAPRMVVATAPAMMPAPSFTPAFVPPPEASTAPALVAVPVVAAPRAYVASGSAMGRFARAYAPSSLVPSGAEVPMNPGQASAPMAMAGASRGSVAELPPIVAPNATAQIPAAFQPPGASENLTPSEQSQVADLQQQFAQDVTAGNPGSASGPAGSSVPGTTNSSGPGTTNPSASVSSEAWNTAQLKSDEAFKLHFGVQAFLQRQFSSNARGDQSAN